MKKLLILICMLVNCSYIDLRAQEELKIPDGISVSKPDKFSNKQTYQHVVFKDQIPFKLYLYGCDTARLLYLKCQYYGKGWIFFDKMLLLNDRGEKLEFKFASKYLDREVASGGYVYETGNRDLSYEEIEKLKSFLTDALKIDVRFVGKYTDDGMLKEKKIKAALELIDFFYTDNKAVDLLKYIYDLEQKLKEGDK